MDVSERLIDFYGMRDILLNDSMAGVDRIFLLKLYGEFAFIGFIVLMALYLSKERG